LTFAGLPPTFRSGKVETMLNVVFLCTGNTCRSPLAAALASRSWGDLAAFSSAGLQAVPGEPASDGARLVATEMGADLEGHRSRPVDSRLLAEADWVIGMTRAHAATFRARYGSRFQGRIGLLGEPGVDLTRQETSASAEEVSDPFGGEIDGYRAIAGQIERLLAIWAAAFRGGAPRTGGGV
jgi:protein-tyrosine-phosphatase